MIQQELERKTAEYYKTYVQVFGEQNKPFLELARVYKIWRRRSLNLEERYTVHEGRTGTTRSAQVVNICMLKSKTKKIST